MVVWMIILSAVVGRAQSIEQLTAQLALDTEKLGHMKSTLQEMYKAYTLLDKGYSDVRDIVQGNFNLHKAFLDGLMAVSPVVRQYSRIVDIINAETALVKEGRDGYNRCAAAGHFTAGELDYLSSLFGQLLDRGLNGLTELEMVLTDGQVRMSDGERLTTIDRVYEGMNEDLGLLRTTNNDLSIQIVQRQRAAGDIEVLRQLHGIQ